MGFLIDLILFVLLLPVAIVWAIKRALEDVVKFFGYWIFPAALSVYSGVLLYIAGPSAPDAEFESIFNILSECVILHARLPLWLLVIGVALLVTGAGLRLSRLGRVTVGTEGGGTESGRER